MRATWVVSGAVAAIAGLLAFGVARRVAMPSCGTPLDRLEDTVFLSKELGLNQAQAREVQSLHAGLGAALGDCCKRHCTARARVAQAIVAGTNDSAAADAALAELCRAYEASERATLDHIRKVRAVLTTEQRERFDAMVTTCMCRGCAMHENPTTCEKAGD